MPVAGADSECTGGDNYLVSSVWGWIDENDVFYRFLCYCQAQNLLGCFNV